MAGGIGAVLGSRSVMRLAIADNRMMRGCEGLGQLVGLRALTESAPPSAQRNIVLWLTHGGQMPEPVRNEDFKFKS
jgi:hypothetical protein